VSASDFNELLAEKYEANGSRIQHRQLGELYDEYIKLHLPDRRPLKNQTNKLEDGLELGAIYVAVRGGGDDWWFVAGYTERWGLEIFYGKCRFGKITSDNMEVWRVPSADSIVEKWVRRLLKGQKKPPNLPNSPITLLENEFIIKQILNYFSVTKDGDDIFIAYSPYPSISRTLNFSGRGFL
jgi:hypothetical protein